MSENKEPKCACCEHGEEHVDKLEKDSINEYGWYAHIVPDDDVRNTPTGMNIHTHHLPESFNHPDLQIVVPVSFNKVNIMMGILHSVVDNYIKKGIKLEPGKEYSEVIKNYKVTVAKTKECERDVLRIILPGPDGYIQRNEPMVEPYSLQYKGTIE